MRSLLILMLISASVYSQNYELYIGAGNSSNNQMNVGYLIGGNFILKTNQDRRYFNKLILGFENSGFMSNLNSFNFGEKENLKTEIIKNCNCNIETIPGISSKGSFTIKNIIRGTALNLGAEIEKSWYLISGVTIYRHMTLLNGEEVNVYKTTNLNIGVKYFWRVNSNTFLTPTIMYNSEAMSFSVGYSR